MLQTVNTFQCKLLADAGIRARVANSVLRERLWGDGVSCVLEDSPYIHPSLMNNQGVRFYYVITNKSIRAQLYLPVKKFGAFKRVELADEYFFVKGDKWRKILELSDFIDLLRRDFGVAITTDLKEELLNSCINLAYSYEAFHAKKQWTGQQLQTVFQQGDFENPENWMQWIEQMKSIKSFDELTYSESMVVEGHPLHPSTKVKRGLSEQEVKQYAPEFEHEIPLLIVLVRRKFVQETTVTFGEAPLLFKLNPTLEEVCNEIVRMTGQSLDDYIPFIVHPWQYENVLPDLYAEELSKGDIVPVPYQLTSRATLSFRTMNLLDSNFHVKLPVRIQATSAVRIVSPEITVDGPVLSNLFEKIVRKDMNALKQLIVLKEPYGAYFKKDDDQQLRGKNLAFLLREDPYVHLNVGERAFVAASLTANNPYTGVPTIIDVMKERYKGSQITFEKVAAFIREYALVFIPPLIHLIQNYGIALEAHMQNTIICVKDCQVKRVMIRDLGGVRIDEEMLKKSFPELKLENSSLTSESLHGVIRKFHHAVIQNHIGDLLFCVSRHFDIDESSLWTVICEVVEQSLNKQLPNYKLIYDYLFSNEIKTKALLKMRMSDTAKTYSYSSFPNPLVKGAY
ncbi:IucA/IucC family protein [Bacillus solimangrovi]|uniref:IucA/IucC family siderophore biosynthesis protein n=1 Tax=Bacillus solimangrovi TaxID=1305675 RepID=A0A1E5LCC1_9BACI|nr:IucA/IucC family protein [Bacillus solimangrovi]OEH91748.1 hypothetical protein BFG57_17750 [Bacillus solimangrovi]